MSRLERDLHDLTQKSALLAISGCLATHILGIKRQVYSSDLPPRARPAPTRPILWSGLRPGDHLLVVAAARSGKDYKARAEAV